MSAWERLEQVYGARDEDHAVHVLCDSILELVKIGGCLVLLLEMRRRPLLHDLEGRAAVGGGDQSIVVDVVLRTPEFPVAFYNCGSVNESTVLRIDEGSRRIGRQ